MNKTIKGSLILIFASLIWGSALLFQSEATAYLGPFTFSTFRFYIGALVLLPIILFKYKSYNKITKKVSIKGGIIAGIFLVIACAFQQIAIANTTVSKAGFITSLYLLFTPIISFFLFKKKINSQTFISLFIAIIGFYLLCVNGTEKIAIADILVLFTAIGFSFQIITIDYYCSNSDSFLFTFIEFLTAGIISNIFMLIFEKVDINNLVNALTSLIYVGAISGGFGYSLQVIGQKMLNATSAGLIMSLESVFALLSEWIFRGISLSPKETLGCLLIFVSVLIVQIPLKTFKKNL